MPNFSVVYDGPSRPMIETPTGRLLSLSELQNGQWVSSEREVKDCEIICAALNWVLVHGPELIKEGIA